MNFIVIDVPQRSEAWFRARLGRLTGSRAGDMLATIKSGEAAARRDYRTQLVCERLTGQSQEDGYTNPAMERGVSLEPAALKAYETLTGNVAQPSGFLAVPDVMAGCSLDGQVDHYAGIVELKCPKSATHLKYLKGGIVPSDYLPQILHNLWVTGAQWCDFLSFDDRFPPEYQVFHVRVERDDAVIADYEKKAMAFLAEVDQEIAALKGWKVCAA